MITLFQAIAIVVIAVLLATFVAAARQSRRDLRRDDARVRADQARWAGWMADHEHQRRFSARQAARELERREREAAQRKLEEAQAIREAEMHRQGRAWLADVTSEIGKGR